MLAAILIGITDLKKVLSTAEAANLTYQVLTVSEQM